MNTLDLFLQWLLDASLRASLLALAVLGLQVALGRRLPARGRHASWQPDSRQSLCAAWLLGACGVLAVGGAGYRRSLRRIARRPHPAWGMVAAFMIVALTLEGATRAQEAGTDQKEKSGFGKFASFKDGKLTLKGNYGGLVWNHIPESTPVVRWDDVTNSYISAGTAEVLSNVEPGTWIIVGGKLALIRVGARKGHTTGTFVSFKDERLLMLGKDLGPAYTKKYGNQLHMHKFAEGVPVYESIDGGEFEFAGNTTKVLPKVKEGAIITVYGEGDDNITRIEIGVPKQK